MVFDLEAGFDREMMNSHLYILLQWKEMRMWNISFYFYFLLWITENIHAIIISNEL